MSLHLLRDLLICFIFINRVICLNYRKAIFVEFDNLYLNTSNKKSMKVNTLTECGHHCLKEENQCKSINFRKNLSRDGKHECEVLRTSSKGSAMPIQDKKNWKHIENHSVGPVSEALACRGIIFDLLFKARQRLIFHHIWISKRSNKTQN